MRTLPCRPISVSIACPLPQAYDFLCQPQNFPQWASGLASGLRRDGDRWLGDGPEGPVYVRFSEPNPWGVLDHHVTLSNGREVYIPLRVVANGDGCEVTLHLFRQPEMTADEFAHDSEWGPARSGTTEAIAGELTGHCSRFGRSSPAVTQRLGYTGLKPRSCYSRGSPMRSARCTLCLPYLFVLLASSSTAAEIGERLERTGDEIVVCGQLFHTTAPVVLWMDPGGYDAYRVERRFSPIEKSSWEESTREVRHLRTPNRYGIREGALSPEELEQVRGGGWDLPLLQRVVDQFVMHYDVCGVSQTCFRVLHDNRCLSVHFMIDVDGTIYQTLDLKERAWHATISNTRSIGVEIAHMGAYPKDNMSVLERWYETNTDEGVMLRPPKSFDELGVRTRPFIGRPDRADLICGTIQGRELCQYDFTPQQYDSLIKLTATLCTIFPKLKCTYPQNEEGEVIPHKLADEKWKSFQGVLGHYHIQQNKIDPGPAFNWEKVVGGALQLLEEKGRLTSVP